MVVYRFENRSNGRIIRIAANNFSQAVSDLYSMLDKCKADQFIFIKSL